MMLWILLSILSQVSWASSVATDQAIAVFHSAEEGEENYRAIEALFIQGADQSADRLDLAKILATAPPAKLERPVYFYANYVLEYDRSLRAEDRLRLLQTSGDSYLAKGKPRLALDRYGEIMRATAADRDNKALTRYKMGWALVNNKQRLVALGLWRDLIDEGAPDFLRAMLYSDFGKIYFEVLSTAPNAPVFRSTADREAFVAGASKSVLDVGQVKGKKNWDLDLALAAVGDREARVLLLRALRQKTNLVWRAPCSFTSLLSPQEYAGLDRQRGAAEILNCVNSDPNMASRKWIEDVFTQWNPEGELRLARIENLERSGEESNPLFCTEVDKAFAAKVGDRTTRAALAGRLAKFCIARESSVALLESYTKENSKEGRALLLAAFGPRISGAIQAGKTEVAEADLQRYFPLAEVQNLAELRLWNQIYLQRGAVEKTALWQKGLAERGRALLASAEATKLDRETYLLALFEQKDFMTVIDAWRGLGDFVVDSPALLETFLSELARDSDLRKAATARLDGYVMKEYAQLIDKVLERKLVTTAELGKISAPYKKTNFHGVLLLAIQSEELARHTAKADQDLGLVDRWIRSGDSLRKRIAGNSAVASMDLGVFQAFESVKKNLIALLGAIPVASPAESEELQNLVQLISSWSVRRD